MRPSHGPDLQSYGREIACDHVLGPRTTGTNLIGEIVTAAGLPARWAATADDPSWDTAITAAPNAAAAASGPEPTSPTFVLDDSPATGLAGPVFTHTPGRPAALRTWDAVHTLLTEPGFTGPGPARHLP